MDHFWNNVSCAIWQVCSVVLPKVIYDSNGDKKILEDQLESMIKYLESIPKEKNFMLWDRSNLQLGDWLDPAAPPDDPAKAVTDPFLIADAFLYYILDATVTILKILGKNDQLENYNRLWNQCREDFRKKYVFQPDHLLNDTQTAFSLFICFGLYENNEELTKAGQKLSDIV